MKITKDKLNEMLQLAIRQCRIQGIEIPGNINPIIRVYNAKSYFGHCRYRSEIDEYEITISGYHLDNPESAVMETMVHEVLHTTKDTRGHCKRWNHYVRMVNKAYGYNISRCGSSDNGYSLNIPAAAERSINYIIECTECNANWKRVRKSKIVKYTENYRCGCGGQLVRIK